MKSLTTTSGFVPHKALWLLHLLTTVAVFGADLALLTLGISGLPGGPP